MQAYGSPNHNHPMSVEYAASFHQQPPAYAALGGANDPPPPYFMEKVAGYESATFDNTILSPPAILDLTEEPLPERRAMENIPRFTEEKVRAAVVGFVFNHCCYGIAAADEMEVTEITMNSVSRYILETYGEKRESAWRFVPFTGQQYIDGPNNGPAPTAWDITATPKHYFKDDQTKFEVPHTAFVKPCHICVGNGRIRCENCMGRGRTGTMSSSPKRCYICFGTGQRICSTCNTNGNLKGFVELTVTWTNHMSEYISETTVMPKELVRNVTGQTALQEEMLRVTPVVNAEDHLVDEMSKNFITTHNGAFPSERIIRQRHHLQIVPIALCSYKWKERSGNFCVYGFEHSVYFPDYPLKYCCGCNIL